MTEPRTGSRYEFQVDRAGVEGEQGRARLLRHPCGRRRGHGGGGRPHRLCPLLRSRQHGRRPRPALRRLPHRLPAALPILPQPRYLAQTQRPPGHRLARDAGDRQIRKGAQDHQGRRHAVGRRADGAAALRDADLPPLQGTRTAHLPRHFGTDGRPDDRSGPDGHRPAPARHQVRRSGHLREGHQPAAAADDRLRAPAFSAGAADVGTLRARPRSHRRL